MPGGYSKVDFKTVGQQISWWLNNVTSPYTGNPNGGEMGNDFGTPQGTPVYAVTGGKLVGAGYYNGGGVVSVEEKPGTVWYYQHLDLVQTPIPANGVTITPGEQVGLSGGQLSGGNHPATCCSNGAHIEVGVNGPWGGIWHPEGPSVDPQPLLRMLLAALKNGDVPTTPPGVQGNSAATAAANLQGLLNGTTAGSSTNPLDTSTLAATSGGISFPSSLLSWLGFPPTVMNWITQPIRWLKMVVGFALVATGVVIFILPLVGKVTGAGLQVGGAVAGQPELVAAGTAVRGAAAGQRRSQGALAGRVARARRPKRPKAPAAGAPPTAQPAKGAANTAGNLAPNTP